MRKAACFALPAIACIPVVERKAVQGGNAEYVRYVGRAFRLSWLCVLASVMLSACALQSTNPTADAQSPARSLQVEELDGGSVVTNLGYNIKINDGSTLRRKWFVVNDPNCPVELKSAGINTVYRSGSAYSSGEYSFVPVGSIHVKDAIQAFEVRFLLFDVWGEHMSTLSGTEVQDLAPGTTLELQKTGSWRAWENDVKDLLSIVAFVAQARTTRGTMWTFDSKSLLREIDKIRLKLVEQELAPEKSKSP